MNVNQSANIEKPVSGPAIAAALNVPGLSAKAGPAGSAALLDDSETEGSILEPMPAKTQARHRQRVMSKPRGSDAAKDAIGEIHAAYRLKLGLYLAECRKAADLSQAKLAKMLGIAVTTMASAEQGYRNLAPSHYETFVAACGLDREAFGKFMLRYSNPWVYALLYGIDADPSLKSEIRRLNAG